MKTIITVVNKATHASSTVSGLHATLAQPSVVELSVDSLKDIAALQRQGDALVISMRSGEVITVDDFYLLHKGVKNTLVIQDSQGELLTPPMDAVGEPVLDTSSFVKIDSIEPLLLDSGSHELSPWWLAGAGLLAGGLALGGGGGGGGGHGSSAPAATAPTAHAVINAINSDSGVVGDFITNDSTLVVTAVLNGALASGEKVQFSLDGGATWHDAQALGNNVYAYDNTAHTLADGTYVFEVRVVNASGIAGVVNSQVVVIDTVAPLVTESLTIAAISDDTGLSSTDFVTSDKTLVISGNLLGAPLAAGEHVEISLDGGTTWLTASVSGNTWSYDNTANALADGTHIVLARVVDAAGNVGYTTSQTVTIDSTADHVLISFSSISPDTGISSVDYITNGTKITFFGTLTAPLVGNDMVQISLDDGVTWHQATVNGVNWEYDPMLDGTYHIIARVIDVAGNISSTASVDLVVDTTPPVVNSSGITEVANPDGSLSVSASAGSAEPGSTVSVLFPDGTTGTALVGSDGSYGPITSGLGQPQGPTSITLTDVAGNVSTPTSLPYPDTTPPTATAVISAISDDTGASGSDFITSDSTLVISAQLTGTLGAGEKVQISLDGGATWHDATLQSGSTYVLDNTANPLADGTYTVQSRVVDAAGNASAVSSQNVTIDTHAGLGNTIAIDGISQDTGVSATDLRTSDNTLVFSGHLGAPLAADEAAQISLDGGITWITTVVAGTAWTYDNTGNPLADGTVAVQVRIVDMAGNVGATASVSVVIDSQAPVTTISLDAISTDTGANASDFITADQTLVFSGSLNAPLAADEFVQISLDGGASWQTATVTGTSWSFDNTANALADGTYTVQVRVSDTAGNMGSASMQLVVIDSSVPSQTLTLDSISTDSGTVGDFITNDATLVFNGQLSAPLNVGSTVEISLDGGSTWTTASVTGTAWSYDASATPLVDGSHVVQVRVTDIAGNSSGLISQTVTIDTSAPVATPAFSSISLDTGTSGDFVTADHTLVFNGTLSAALGSGEVLQFSLDGGLTWSATTVTGTSWTYDNTGITLPDNTYLAQLRVVDAAGNIGATAQQAVVVSSIPPAATVALSGITTDTGSNSNDFVTSDQTLIFNLTLTGSLAAGESVQLSLDGGTTWQTASQVSPGAYAYDNTGNVLADGTYTVMARVTDVAGNISAVSSQNVVIDTQVAAGNSIAITAISQDTGVSASDFHTNDNTLVFFGSLGAPLAVDESAQISFDGGATWLNTQVAGLNWTYDNTANVLTDGTVAVQVRIVDVAGNVGATGSTNVVVDTQAPAAGITLDAISTDTGANASDFITADQTLVFSGSLSAPLLVGEFVQISLDGGASWQTATASGTSWSFDNTANALVDGSYTVQVRVNDTAGNVGNSSTQLVVIDSSVPSQTLTLDSISTDSGTVGDFITNDATLVFNGQLSAPLNVGSTVEISLDGGSTWTTASVTGTAWSYDASATPLVDGSHVVQVRVTDIAGNSSGLISQTVTIDTSAPTATPAFTSISVDSGTSGDFITSDHTLVFNGTLSAALGSGEVLQFSLDGGLTWSATTVTGTSWSYDNTGITLPDSTYTAQLRVVDAAGNVGATAQQTVVISDVAPTASVALTGISTDTGSNASDFITSDQTLIFNLTLTGTLATGESVQLSLDGGSTWQTASQVSPGAYAYDNTSSVLTDGTYTVMARVIDVAGNSSAVSSQSVTIDTALPLANSIALTAISQDTGSSASDFHTNDNTLMFFGSLGAPLAGNESAQISFDGGATWANTQVTGTTWSYDNSANPFADGTVAVQMRIVNVAGNVGATGSTSVVIDTQASVASISLDAITTDTGTNASDFHTSDNTLVFSGALSVPLAGDEFVQISLDGGTSWQTATAAGTGWSFDNTANTLADGSYTVQVRINDSAGNLGASASQLVVIDSSTPAQTLTLDSISTDSGIAGDFITNDATLIFNGQLSAPLAVGSIVEVSLDGGATWNPASVTGTSWSFDNTSSTLSDGSHVVQARVTDLTGNSGAAISQTVTVDTSAPISSTPLFTSISVDSGTSSTDFMTMDRTLLFNGTLSAPLASDETLQFSLDGGLTWAATTVSGTSWTYDNTSVSLADNTYTAQLRVVDAAGNVGATAQQVVVISNVAPTATVAISGITTDTGSSASDFVTSDQTLIFNVALTGTLAAGESVQVSLDGGSTWQTAALVSPGLYALDNTANPLSDGVYTVEARVTDVAGNTSPAGSQVVVIDSSAPTTGNAVAIVSYTDTVAQNVGLFGDGTSTNDPAATLNGTVSGLNAGDQVQVFEGTTMLGLATVSGGTWSYQLSATADGAHTYHVVIVDAAGNSGTASSDFSLTVDTQAPSASTTVGIVSISDDSGTAGDFITNDNTLVFNGVLGAPLTADESVQVTLDGGAHWLNATVTGTTWTLDYSSTVLADNTYTVQARVIDAAGNVGQTTSQSVVVDTTAPNASITVSITGISVDTGSSGSDYNTADNTLLFQGNLGLPLGSGQHVEISLDGGTSWSTVAMTGPTAWQYDNTANVMADGAYTVVARVVDTAGNVGQTASQVVNIDSTAPVGNSVEILAISPDSGSPTDFFTNTGVLTFSGTITSPLNAGEHVEISVDNGVTWVDATVTGTTWTFDNTAHDLADGTYNLQARISDVFGNIEQTATKNITIDTMPPSAAATVAITAISDDTGTVGDFITSDNTLMFSGTLGAPLQSGEGLRVSFDGGASWSVATVTGTTWTYDHTAAPLADGTYTLLAQTFDVAGNTGQSATQSFTVDTSLPSASVTISGITTDSGAAGDFVTSDQTLMVTTTLSGALNPGEKVQISVDGGTSWHDATPVNGTTYTYDNTANTLAEGTYTFQTRVVDSAGTSGAVSSQQVTIDTTGPSVGYTLSLDTYTDDVPAVVGDFASGTSTNDTTPLLHGTVTGLVSGDTVQVYEGSTLLGLATVSGNTWQYQLGATADGAHTYHAVLLDAAGNSGLASSNFNLTVDTLVPSASETISITAITTDSGVNGDFNTNDNTLVFSGTLSTALAAGEGVEFSLDGGVSYHAATVTGTTWSYDHSGTTLLDNTYNLTARIVDAAGNVGQSASQTLVVDTTAPTTAQTIAFSSITTDTGDNTADFITSDPTLIFNGVLGAPLLTGENVEVQINGGGWQAATHSGLTWTFDHSATTLLDGNYTVQARVVDTAGNVGQSATQTVVVDTTVPSATVAITGITDNTGATNDFITSDPTLLFSGTLSAPLAAGEQVFFSYDGGANFYAATVSGTTWSYDYRSTALGEGAHSLQARVVDAAGNFGTTVTQTLTIDTQAPTATIAFGAISDDTGVANDYVTSDPNLTFNGTLSAVLASDERVEISLDGGTSWATASVTGTNWSFDNTANTLSNASHDLVVRVIDAADNIGASVSKTLVVDAQAPTPTITIDAIASDTGLDNGASLHDFITQDHTLILTGSLSAALVGDEFVEISVDGGSSWKTASVSGTTWTLNNTSQNIPDGNYTIVARVTDLAGNIGHVSTQALIIDNAAPSQTLTLTAISTDSGVVGDFITQDNTLVFSGQLSAALTGDSVVQVRIDGGQWATASVTGTTWSFDNSASVLLDGSHLVEARVADSAGNSSVLATQSVTVDTTPPAATTVPTIDSITLDLGTSANDFITLDRSLIFNGTLTAPLASGESLQFSIDGGVHWDAATVTTSGSNTTWTYNNTSQSLGNGTYTAQVQVVDTAGNVGAMATQTVVIYNAIPAATVSITGITDNTGSTSDYVTSDQTLVFSLTLVGTLGSDQFVQISLDGGASWNNATAAGGNTYVFDNTAQTLSEGTYALQARVFDVAGNSSPVASQTLVVDITAPTTGNAVAITTYTDDVDLNMGNFGAGTQTNDAAPVLNGTVSGLNSGDSVLVYEGSTFLGTATVTAGTWSFQLAATSDGVHTYHAVITDTAGNAGTASADFGLTVYTQAPSASTTVSITGITDDSGTVGDFITNDSTLTISGVLGAPLLSGEHVEVRVDGGNWAAATVTGTTWSFDNTANTLSSTTHTVDARVVNDSGNIGQTATHSLVVDTTPPSAATTVHLTGISLDTGADGNDYKTSDNTLIFFGQTDAALQADEHVEISLDNGANWFTVTMLPSSTTEWTYDNQSNIIADGTHSILTRVVDAAGNVGQSSSQDIVVDSTAPVGNVVEFSSISPDSGTPDDYFTNIPKLVFSGIITSAFTNGEHVELSFDNQVTWHTATVSGTNWTYDNTANALPEGSQLIYARIVDLFGNVEQTSSQEVRIDTQAPSASTTVQITGLSVDSGTVGDFITSHNQLTFSGTLGAPLQTASALHTAESVQVSVDGGAHWQTATVSGLNWTADFTGTQLADGAYTLLVQVLDQVGNTGQSATHGFTIDTSAPTASAVISAITTDSGVAGDFITNDQSLVVTATLTGTLQPDEHVEISVDNGAHWNTATAIGGGLYTFDNTANTLGEGPQVFQARVVDTAGNASSVASQNVTIDITGPTVGYTIGLNTYTDDVFALLGNFGTGTSTNDTTPLLNGTITGLVTGDTVQVYEGSSLLGLATVTGTTWTYQLGVTSQGAHTYHAAVVDKAGNLGLASADLTLTVDTVAPDATKTISFGPLSSDTGLSSTDYKTATNQLIFSGTLGAALAADEHVEFSFDGGTSYVSVANSGLTWTYDYHSTALLDGSYNLKVRVVDAAGNAGQSASNQLIIDTQAPSATETIAFSSVSPDTGSSSNDFVTSSRNLTFTGTLGAPLLGDEIVQLQVDSGTWVAATTTSASGWTFDYSATTLGQGPHTVNARIIDGAGNVGQTATQGVTVDFTPPTTGISFQTITDNSGATNDFTTNDPNLIVGGSLTAALQAGERVMFSYDGGTNYYQASVTGTTWSYDMQSITLLDGDHAFKVRVEDAAGNSASGTNTANQTVTIDTQAPTQTITIASITPDTGVSNDFITSSASVTLKGVLGAALGAGERVEISLNSGVSWATVTSVTGTNWTNVSTLADGTYQTIVRVIDLADNIGQTASKQVIIDTQAPTATGVVTAITPDNGISSTDLITNSQNLSFDVTLTGTLNSGENVQISTDNGASWSSSLATQISANVYRVDNTSVTLGEATYSVKARVVDLAGNAGTATPTGTSVTIDTHAPAVTAITLTAVTTDTASGLVVGTGSTTDSAVNTDFNTRDTSLTVNGGYTGTINTASEFLQISTDGTTWTTVPTANINTTSKTWTYTDGTPRTSSTTYQLRVIDTAGNIATGTASQTITVDTQAPSIATLLAPVLTAAFDTGVVGDNITTTTTAITFTSATSGLGEANTTIALVNDVDNDGIYSQGIDNILAIAAVSATGTWSLSTAGQAVGNYHLAFMGTDAAGNRSVLSGVNNLRVVPSDVGSDTSIGSLEGGTSPLVGKMDHGGLWTLFETQGAGGRILYWNQTGLSSVNGYTDVLALHANSMLGADYQRSGYQSIIAIGEASGSPGTPMIRIMSTVNDGHYTFATLTGNSRTYGAVVAYDKNGDGYLDFAFGDIANTSLSFVSNILVSGTPTLQWMNGTQTTGTGRPSGTGAIATINNYAEASAVDLNNNGTVDVIEHTNNGGSFSLTAFMNDQSLTSFTLTNTLGVFATPSGSTGAVAMTWADFNNDGYMDLYLNKGRNATNTADSNASRIYWNDHSGGFGTTAGTTGGTATYFSDTLNGSGSLAIDWNHDGKMDVIEFPAPGVTGNVVWYQNLGGGVFSSGVNISNLSRSDFLGATPVDFRWSGTQDLLVNISTQIGTPVINNNNPVADGTSLHLQIFDSQGFNVYYGNVVQLYNSAGALVSSQIINPQSGLTTNDSSGIVYFYGLSATETYTAVLLNSVGGVSSDVSGVASIGGYPIENVNAAWTGLSTGLATHNYVLSAESGTNSANGNFVGSGYNDTFFATAGTDTINGGGGWLTHYGTPTWSTSGGEDIIDFRLAGTTALTVNLNTTTAQNTGFNTVTLTNIEGITGAGGNDNLTANTTTGVNSLLDGRGGNDTYTITGGGHTLLTFTNINNADATGGNGSDTAIGFGVGNVATVTTADVIDLHALLTGYTGTAYTYHDTTTNKDVLDKASEGLLNYLTVTPSGANTVIAIDRDGAGTTFNSTVVLTLNNVTTDLPTLLVNHQLIV